MVSRPLRATTTIDLAWLPERLRAAGYSSEALRRVVGAASADDVGLLNRAVAIERSRGDSSIAARLLRLFFLETAEPPETLRAAFDEMELARLQRIGLLRAVRVGGQRRIASRARIDAVEDLYLLADRRFSPADAGALGLPAGDPVYAASSDSLLLAQAMGDLGPGTGLDLCTGTGLIGLLMARAGMRVRAIDLNPRAVALALINARMNRVESFETVEADLYRRDGGRRFDVITANPPFVTSPYDNAPSFHAGGPTGDRVLRRVLRGLNRALADGGRAYAIAHVGLRRGRSLEEVASGWLRDFGGSAAVVEIERGTIVDLAAAQALFALDRGLAAYGDEVRLWADFLRRHDIETIVAVLVAARQDGGQQLDVIDARVKVLPIPLGPGPVDAVRNWMG